MAERMFFPEAVKKGYTLFTNDVKQDSLANRIGKNIRNRCETHRLSGRPTPLPVRLLVLLEKFE